MEHSKGHILFVLTNNGELGDTGRRTGAFLSEIAHPYKVVTDAGFEVDFVSPRGGQVPLDPGSLQDLDGVSQAFYNNASVRAQLEATASADAVSVDDYDAIYFAGGHGTMWDLPDDAAMQRLTAEIYERGGVVGAVCHGPAGLVNVKLSDGDYLVARRQVSAFTTAEEVAAGLRDAVPFLLDERLRERGAAFTSAGEFQAHVVRDERLVTGQNPASAYGVGEAMVEMLVQGQTH